jgi:ribokinase
MSNVTVVGSLNVDHVLRVKRLPLKGESIILDSYDLYSGGKGANQAAAIGKLGIEVNMIGKVGKDDLGIMLIEGLKKSNVNTDGIIIDKYEKTGSAFITVDKHGNNTLVVAPGANGKLTIDDINVRKQKLEESSIIVMQMEIPTDAIFSVIDYAKKSDKLLILNYAPAVAIDRNMLSDVDYLVVNETEFQTLTQNDIEFDSLDISLKKIRDFFGNILIITLGEKGSISITKENQILKLPGYEVESIDSTAAGDAFIGGLVFGLITGKSIEESIKLGNANGAISVTKPGAQASLPDRNELYDFLKQ